MRPSIVLLSLFLAGCAIGTAQTPTSVTLTLSGAGTVGGNTLTANGTGTLAPFGSITAAVTVAATASIFETGNGNASLALTLTLSDGDTLTASGEGVATADENAGTLVVAGSATVTQGTGEFAGASGTLSYSVVIPHSSIVAGSFQYTTTGPGTLVVPSLGLVGSMPHFAAQGGWNTTLTIVNKRSSPVNTVANLFADNGSALSVPLTLPQQPSLPAVTAASAYETLPANASWIVEASGPDSAPFMEGSAQLGAATGAADGFAIFHYDPTEQEAVVPLETRNAPSYLIAFDDTSDVVTGIAIDNVSSQNANIPVVFRNDSGVSIGYSTITLNAFGHTSFVLSTQYPSTANVRGTVEFDTPPNLGSGAGQISVLGIRYTPPGTLTTIPSLANVGTTGGYMSHIASGAGWETTFVLVNNDYNAATSQAQLSFFDNNGNPLSLPLTFPQTGATSTASVMTQSIAAGATLWVETSGPLASALLTGSAQLTTTGNIGGYAIFRYNPNGQEAVVPLETRNASKYLLAFDNTSGIATGLAISVASSQAVNVPVILRDDTGAQVGTGTIPLAANGHYSQILSTLFPATANIRGTAEFDTPSGSQISVLGIRSPPALTFTTLPALAN